MGIAVFDYAVWALRYPALAATVSEPLATSYFGDASIILDNTDCSIVTDVNVRLSLLNMLVAHIAVLNGALDAGGGAAPVGRVTSASEGGVSVSFADMGGGASAAWFQQTQYGALYWQATVGYRSAIYVPGPEPYLGVGGYPGGRDTGYWGIM